MGGLGIMGDMGDMRFMGIMGLMGNASVLIIPINSHQFPSINLSFSRSNIPFRALRANCGEPVTFAPLCRRVQENQL